MRVSFDAVTALDGLELLGESLYEVQRAMGVAVGQAFRDEAKANVREHTGNLKRSLYLALDTDETNDKRLVYTVSWNRKIAPHGHLPEFGYWQTHVSVQLPNGTWTSTQELLNTPKWVAATPFMRPALGTILPRSMKIAAAAGRKRLEELLNGGE